MSIVTALDTRFNGMAPAQQSAKDIFDPSKLQSDIRGELSGFQDLSPQEFITNLARNRVSAVAIGVIVFFIIVHLAIAVTALILYPLGWSRVDSVNLKASATTNLTAAQIATKKTQTSNFIQAGAWLAITGAIVAVPVLVGIVIYLVLKSGTSSAYKGSQ